MMRFLLICWLGLGGFAQAQLTDFGDIDFHRADSIADIYQGEDLSNLPLLSYRLTEHLTNDIEKFRAIFTWVCKNIEYDNQAYLRNKKNRKKLGRDSVALNNWNQIFQVKVFKKLLNDQITVCTGYAYLLKELSSFAGINCKIIDGYGRTATVNITGEPVPNHSWNAVELNGKWYLSDPTWASGIFSIPDYVFEPEFNDGYFLVDPALFIINHYPLNPQWILLEEKPSLEAFMDGPFVYRQAFKKQIIPVEPKVLDAEISRDEHFHFFVKAPDSIDLKKLSVDLVIGSNIYPQEPHINRTDEGLLDISCEFKRKGQHDVHLKIEDKAMVTYVVKVRKN